MFLFTLLLSLFVQLHEPVPQTPAADKLVGAWEASLPDNSQALWIIDGAHFAITHYRSNEPEFISTEGGKWFRRADGSLEVQWEFNTREPKRVGQTERIQVQQRGSTLKAINASWKRIDNGMPGELQGAWLITGRMRDGEMSTMTPGARKTMKILSGTRFQWIAYNSETAEFSGTGGGAYTTQGGTYTENIAFFSRDSSRVGASLSFEYERRGDQWHHKGLSSKGEPIYEIWSTRQSLGL